jgi:hypothetical protein
MGCDLISISVITWYNRGRSPAAESRRDRGTGNREQQPVGNMDEDRDVRGTPEVESEGGGGGVARGGI